MDLKEMTQVMYSYKELAYLRKSALYSIRETVYADPVSPEERLDKVKEILKTLGLTPRDLE